MTRPEEMRVPQNVREEFDTSEINVGMNAVEEANKHAIFADDPYIPEPDPRSLNVVERIEDIRDMYKAGELPVHVDDDYVLKADIKDIEE